MSLYKLVGEYNELYDLLTSGEDEEVVKDTLEAVQGEIEVKAKGYISVMNQLEMEMKACKEEQEKWKNEYKKREDGLKWLKQNLIKGMTAMNVTEINTGLHKLKMSNAGGVEPIVYDGEVPNEYMKPKIEYVKDTDKIRAELKKGDLPFCHFGERAKVLKW